MLMMISFVCTRHALQSFQENNDFSATYATFMKQTQKCCVNLKCLAHCKLSKDRLAFIIM